MKDPEWAAWSTNWSGAEGPLPDIRARARAQASRHRRASILFFSLMAAGLGANLVLQDDPIFRWVVIGFGVVLSIVLAWIQRGATYRSGNPREALAFLERRVRVERQGAQVARWAFPPFMLFVAIYYRDLFGHDALVAKLVARGIFVVIAAILISAPWWVRRWEDRQQTEIRLWRSWMDEQQL
jgi:hypothetical protein